MPAQSVVLILNHAKDRHLLELYAELEHACGRDRDVVLLSDRSRKNLSFARKPAAAAEVKFELADLVALNYSGKQQIALPGKTQRNLKLGNADLPVLLFYRQRNHYKHYWVIEYDVRYSGSWRHFLAAFDSSDADLLGTSLTGYPECPTWSHWKSLDIPSTNFRVEDGLRGFFPVYRLSNDALACLHDAYGRGSRGHMETLVPTTLAQSGLRLEDIGGDGAFVKPQNINRFYTNQRTTNNLSPGTFVYRPACTVVGDEPDRLWHPVKPPEGIAMGLANRVFRHLQS